MMSTNEYQRENEKKKKTHKKMIGKASHNKKKYKK